MQHSQSQKAVHKYQNVWVKYDWRTETNSSYYIVVFDCADVTNVTSEECPHQLLRRAVGGAVGADSEAAVSRSTHLQLLLWDYTCQQTYAGLSKDLNPYNK